MKSIIIIEHDGSTRVLPVDSNIMFECTPVERPTPVDNIKFSDLQPLYAVTLSYVSKQNIISNVKDK